MCKRNEKKAGGSFEETKEENLFGWKMCKEHLVSGSAVTANWL